MSGIPSIAEVTQAFQMRMNNLARTELSGYDIQVWTKSPGELTGIGTGVSIINLFLFSVVPNASYRNEIQDVQALDLRYLVTFAGANQTQSTREIHQRLLGMVSYDLFSNPVLEVASGGADAVRVRFDMIPQSIDEISRLWAAFAFETPYLLSVLYEASPVFILGDVSPDEQPVKEVKIESTLLQS